MTDLPRQIAAVLRKSHSVLIACHVGPDGDTLGSALALALALRRRGVVVDVGSADGVPDPFRTLPGADQVLTTPPARPAGAAVAVECSTVERAGSFGQSLVEAQTLINIDHHLSNAGFGHLVYWDTSAASVGELMAHVIRALRVRIDSEIARCLLTAVVTDTGVFRYPNTSEQSLRLAADLVAAGASVSEIVKRVYETRAAGAVRLQGMALAAYRRSFDDRIAWTVVTPEMLATAGARPEDVTGIVAILRQIEGVQIALLFDTTSQGIRVAIRSGDGARSHVIAEAFGGGGHQGAAGFVDPGPLDQVIADTLTAAQKELQQTVPPTPSRP